MVGRGAFGNPWLFRDARALLEGRAEARGAGRGGAVRRGAGARAPGAAPAGRHPARPSIEFRKHFGWYTKGCTARASCASGSSRWSRSPRRRRSSSGTSRHWRRWRDPRTAGRAARRGRRPAASPRRRRSNSCGTSPPNSFPSPASTIIAPSARASRRWCSAPARRSSRS